VLIDGLEGVLLLFWEHLSHDIAVLSQVGVVVFSALGVVLVLSQLARRLLVRVEEHYWFRMLNQVLFCLACAVVELCLGGRPQSEAGVLIPLKSLFLLRVEVVRLDEFRPLPLLPRF